MIYKIILSVLLALVLGLGVLKHIADDGAPAPIASPAGSADDASRKSLRIP